MLCPITKNKCYETACEWYCEDEMQCAIKVSAICLNEITLHIEEKEAANMESCLKRSKRMNYGFENGI